MGKRLVAMSLMAALVAWPVLGQSDGSVILEQEAAPPPMPRSPAAEPPVPVGPVAVTPHAVAPEDSEPVAKAVADSEPPAEEVPTDPPLAKAPDEEPPALEPILPIGDEPIADAGVDPAAKADPDNRIGACRDDTLYIRGDFGKARFTVDVVRTAEERAQGLMNVKFMPTSKGMLFVYPAPQPVAFWMKNTLIPLDMIFADRHGVVVKVHHNAIPGDLTSIPGGDQVQFVLEINGGWAKLLRIEEGAQIRHPAVRRAAWPC
ncbi:DUF192 domain-containing protein [Antarctobacter sp.]|uniref:DUF192 domain-containing protein n=1 Tax=Antarctobacter sp. TaxID=1872577 RepID=UPI003A9142A5